MKPTLLFLCLICSFALIAGMDCNESLPPREQPSHVYDISLTTAQADIEYIRRDISTVMGGKGGLGFTVDVKNVFDETLADTVKYTLGEIEIWWTEDPFVKATLSITIRNEIMTHEIGFWGDITFDPGDSLRLAKVWRFLNDDNGDYMWSHISPVMGQDGPEYPPMEFEAQARIQLFESTAIVYSNILRFRIFFNGS
jgi:hypothetical protein